MIESYTFRHFFQASIAGGTSGFLLPTSGNKTLIPTTSSSKLFGKPFSIVAARSVLSVSINFDQEPSEYYRAGFVLTTIPEAEVIARLYQAQTFYAVGALTEVESDRICIFDEVFCNSIHTSAYSGSYNMGGSKSNDFGVLQPVFRVNTAGGLFLWAYLENGSNTTPAGQSGAAKITVALSLTVEV